MAANRIESIIGEIYDFVESCKTAAFSPNKAIVPKDELLDLLDSLRASTPEEIKRYQKIIANREAILKDAENKAAEIVEQAKQRAAALINESDIMQQAYAQANETVQNATAQAERIMESANHDANQIRTGALAYTEDILRNIEGIMKSALEENRARSEALNSMLSEKLEIISENRSEIDEQLNPKAKTEEAEESSENSGDAEEAIYNLGEDAFLNNVDE